jgi:hypothetical protein
MAEPTIFGIGFSMNALEHIRKTAIEQAAMLDQPFCIQENDLDGVCAIDEVDFDALRAFQRSYPHVFLGADVIPLLGSYPSKALLTERYTKAMSSFNYVLKHYPRQLTYFVDFFRREEEKYNASTNVGEYCNTSLRVLSVNDILCDADVMERTCYKHSTAGIATFFIKGMHEHQDKRWLLHVPLTGGIFSVEEQIGRLVDSVPAVLHYMEEQKGVRIKEKNFAAIATSAVETLQQGSDDWTDRGHEAFRMLELHCVPSFHHMETFHN